MVILLLVYLLFANVVSYSSSMYSNKALEGYPEGYISDCPVAQQKPIITKKTLKHLSFVLQGKGDDKTAKKTRYSYYQMDELAKDPQMDFSKKTAIYVGGFLDFPGFLFATNLAPIYKKLDYNMLILDHSYFTTMLYPVAALFTRTVGKHAAEMLSNLSEHGLDPKKLELVGLSLGGHTVSFIAKNYRQLTGMNISRVTGLDPSGPCFRNLGPADRLDKTDADFVDTINTNIDGFGMAAPVGHVNFYVNGGEFQPGDVLWVPCDMLCSHIRSYTLWLAALQSPPDSFMAMQCSSVQEARKKDCYDKVPQITNVVGLETDRSKKGIFYLTTQNKYPYYLGKEGLKKENERFSFWLRKIVENAGMIV